MTDTDRAALAAAHGHQIGRLMNRVAATFRLAGMKHSLPIEAGPGEEVGWRMTVYVAGTPDKPSDKDIVVTCVVAEGDRRGIDPPGGVNFHFEAATVGGIQVAGAAPYGDTDAAWVPAGDAAGMAARRASIEAINPDDVVRAVRMFLFGKTA